MTEGNIVQFQIDRQIKSLFKNYLILIEERDSYIQKLEKTLVDMGIDAYQQSRIDYQKDRKYILSQGNNAIRELTDLIENFEVSLKK